MNEWGKTHEWEKTHNIEHEWHVVGELVYKGLPMALLCNPTRFMPWCVQYAGSGHYFKTRQEAEEWAYNRRNGRNKSTVMKNVVYASDRVSGR